MHILHVYKVLTHFIQYFTIRNMDQDFLGIQKSGALKG